MKGLRLQVKVIFLRNRHRGMEDKGVQVAIGSKRKKKKTVLVVKQHYKLQRRNVRRNVECFLQGAMVATVNTISGDTTTW